MTHLCELCGRPAEYRFKLGFQMVACRDCGNLLADPTNWVLVNQVLPRPDYHQAIDQWRQDRTGMTADGARIER